MNRIENRIGGGVPDVYICIDGYSIWLELKVTKTHRVSVSPHQIAWHYSLSQSKGTSFYLVKALSSSNLYLFDGAHGRGLAEHGLRVGVRDSGSGFSGSGLVVPCLWHGDKYQGLIDYLTGFGARDSGFGVKVSPVPFGGNNGAYQRRVLKKEHVNNIISPGDKKGGFPPNLSENN